MPVPTSMAGSVSTTVEHHVDARWLMAYAAVLDDHAPAHVDTTRPGGIVGHPLFGVCVEWPAIVASRDRSLEAGVSGDEVQRGVHAWHDTTVHRLVRPGDHLHTRLDTVGVEAKRPGAMITLRLTTVDASGAPVVTTTQGGINLGVATEGADRPDPDPPSQIEVVRSGEPDEVPVPVPAGLGHTYTECARIWNPIHTDRAVALAAGLPDIILHGTATMALGVSAVVRTRAGADPGRVRRITGRFGAMVLMGSTITVRIWPAVADASGDGAAGVVPYEILNAEGSAAVSAGAVVLG